MSKTLRELPITTSTVSGDIYHISGSDLLDKRITIDDISIAVRETLKGPLIADGDVTIQTGGLLKARSDSDTIHEIARCKIWGASDVAYFSHFDGATTGKYIIGGTSSGASFINAATGQLVSIRNNNGNVATFSGDSISLLKNTFVDGYGVIQGSSSPTLSSSGLHLDYNTGTGEALLTSPGNVRVILDSNNNTNSALFIVGKDTLVTPTNILTISETGEMVHTGTTSDTFISFLNDNTNLNPLSIKSFAAREYTFEITSSSAGKYIINNTGAGRFDLEVNGFSKINSLTNNTILELTNNTTSTNPLFFKSEIVREYTFEAVSLSDCLLKLDNTGGGFFNLSVAGTITCGQINTGQGLTEVYLMDQNVRTTDDVTFNSINTGQGLTDVYLMNQNIRTTDTVTFSNLIVGEDLDINSIIGKARIGLATGGASGTLYISHYDQHTITNYGISIAPSGQLDLNIPTGQVLNILNNNATTLASFSTSSIDFGKRIIVNGDDQTEIARFTNDITSTNPLSLKSINVREYTFEATSLSDCLMKLDNTGGGLFNLTVAGTITCGQIDTSQGATEVYLMNQNIRTTDPVIFSSINTDNANIKMKIFTGSLDTVGDVTFTHGLTFDKILSVEAIGKDNTQSTWYKDQAMTADITSTTIKLSFGSSVFDNSLYRCIVTYEA